MAFGLSLSLFIATSLLIKKNAGIQDKILLIWVIILGLVIILAFYEDFNLAHGFPFPFVFIFRGPLAFLHGPLFYLFVFYSINHSNSFNKVHLYHFLPFMISFILIAQRHLLGDHEILESLGNAFHRDIRYLIPKALIVFSIASYSFLAFRKLLKKRHTGGSTTQSNIRALKLFALIIFISSFLNIGIGLAQAFAADFDSHHTYVALHLYLSLILFIIGILVLHYPNSSVETSPNCHTHPVSHEEKLVRLHQEMLAIFEKQKPYLQHDLSLPDLARMLGTNDHYLSQSINRHTGMNFFDLINSYRVNEFKSLLRKPESNCKRILDLAYDSGFNSKTSFNRSFKKLTGMTPSEYRLVHCQACLEVY